VPVPPTFRPRAVLLGAVAVALCACQPAPAATPRLTPGTAGVPRDVNVIAKEWTFVPSVVDFVPGETVVLHLLNGGTEPHEWVFGGTEVQAAWEAAEAAVAGAPPGPTPSVSVPPGVAGLRVTARSGERVDVHWTVPADGPTTEGFAVGCHIPGHFANGMVVPVRWVGPDGVPLARRPRPAGRRRSSETPAPRFGRRSARWYPSAPRRCSGGARRYNGGAG
jgi:hypothetical protein